MNGASQFRCLICGKQATLAVGGIWQTLHEYIDALPESP